MKNLLIPAFLFAALSLLTGCSDSEPQPYGALPTAQQVEWQRMEINMFCHFGPNTFSGKEWGDGTEAESLFNPTALDCRQWVDVAEQAGMKGIIITAKHHDGFCLWPSAFSSHTVAQSSWRGGKGDVLRELRDACRGRVKMGVYLSPWDRNDPTYGTPEYNARFAATLREVHSTYGPLFEQWFDGANGEGPNGRKQDYDWPLFNSTVLGISPLAVIFSDVGPGCRWVGNEEGRAGETCWSTLDTEAGAPGTGVPSPDILNQGQRHGRHWVPAEADVSIRPSWFYHPDEHPKSVDELMEIYYNTVGRNALLLLNVPPTPSGRIASEDSLRLVEFRRERERIFSRDLAQGASFADIYLYKGKSTKYSSDNLLDTNYYTFWIQDTTSTENIWISIALPEKRTFDLVMLQEYIPLGQRVTRFHVTAFNDDIQDWETIAEGTTVGYKRIVRLDKPVTASHLHLYIDSALAPPILNRFALFSTR